MKSSKISSVVTALAAFGCASGGAEPRPSAIPPDAAAQAALVDSVRSTYTPADVAFMAGMIHHHAQALVMSRMAPTHGASPQLQVLARRIINAQNDEIDLMQRWLREHGEHVPEPEAAAETGNGEHGAHEEEAGHGADAGHAGRAGHDARMPGMLTPEQMSSLDAARGEEFDRLFLSLMIQHHQGAITMVEELVATPGGAREESVFKLASDIGADQASEITRMQTMLRDLLFSDTTDGPSP